MRFPCRNVIGPVESGPFAVYRSLAIGATIPVATARGQISDFGGFRAGELSLRLP
jgi:hypothetical protein